MIELRPLARLMVESVLGESGPLPAGASEVSLDEVMLSGLQHRVRPALRRRFRAAPDAPAEWLGPLEAARRGQLIRQMQAVHDLNLMRAAFAERRLRWAVAKGPVLANTVWPHVDMREFSDLDVFVHPEDFGQALGVLERLGAVYVDRNWPEILRLGRAELALRGPSGFPIDLHWDVAVSRPARQAFRTDLPAMLARARTVELGDGLVVPTFDASDTVVHLAHHAAHSGANRLVWLADVLHASSAPEVDWRAVSQRALQAGMGITVGIVLARAERTFGVEFPLTSQLRHCATRSLSGVVAARRDRHRSFPHLPHDPAASGIEYSSARRNDLLSLLAAVDQWFGVRRTEWRVRRHGPDENPLDKAVEDPSAKAEYLELVVGEGVVPRRVIPRRG